MSVREEWHPKDIYTEVTEVPMTYGVPDGSHVALSFQEGASFGATIRRDISTIRIMGPHFTVCLDIPTGLLDILKEIITIDHERMRRDFPKEWP